MMTKASVASAPGPSSHCCTHCHRCHRIVIVTARPHLWRNPFRRRKRQKSLLFLRQNKLTKANLDQVFSESRSGMITHKNKKRITAVTHQLSAESHNCGFSFFNCLTSPCLELLECRYFLILYENLPYLDVDTLLQRGFTWRNHFLLVTQPKQD